MRHRLLLTGGQIGSFFATIRAKYRADLALREVRIAEREHDLTHRNMELDKQMMTNRELYRRLSRAVSELSDDLK